MEGRLVGEQRGCLCGGWKESSHAMEGAGKEPGKGTRRWLSGTQSLQGKHKDWSLNLQHPDKKPAYWQAHSPSVGGGGACGRDQRIAGGLAACQPGSRFSKTHPVSRG